MSVENPSFEEETGKQEKIESNKSEREIAVNVFAENAENVEDLIGALNSLDYNWKPGLGLREIVKKIDKNIKNNISIEEINLDIENMKNDIENFFSICKKETVDKIVDRILELLKRYTKSRHKNK